MMLEMTLEVLHHTFPCPCTHGIGCTSGTTETLALTPAPPCLLVPPSLEQEASPRIRGIRQDYSPPNEVFPASDGDYCSRGNVCKRMLPQNQRPGPRSSVGNDLKPR